MMLCLPQSFAGDSELALGTCPARAGLYRPHTYTDGRKRAATPVVAAAGAPPLSAVTPISAASPDRVLTRPPTGEGNDATRPSATSSDVPRPPGLETHPGAGPKGEVPRERPEENPSAPS